MIVLDDTATGNDYPAGPAVGACCIVGGQQAIAMEIEVYNATATIEILFRPLKGARSLQRSQPFNLIPQVKSFTSTPLYAPCGFFAKSATTGTPATIFARVYELSDVYTLGGNAAVTQTVSGGQPVPFSADFIRYNFANVGTQAPNSWVDIETSGAGANANSSGFYVHTRTGGFWVDASAGQGASPEGLVQLDAGISGGVWNSFYGGGLIFETRDNNPPSASQGIILAARDDDNRGISELTTGANNYGINQSTSGAGNSGIARAVAGVGNGGIFDQVSNGDVLFRVNTAAQKFEVLDGANAPLFTLTA